MKILFVSHYFHPEVGAPQTRILETAQRLQDRGHGVTVLTGFPNYPDGVIPGAYRGRPLLREQVGGIHVLRSAVYPAPNRGFGRRLINHASFAMSSILASPLARDADVVIAETPPLFTAVAAVLIARGRRAPLVLNVADLWPESAVQLGALSNPRSIQLAEALERFAYRHAAAITLPTAGMRANLLRRGEHPDRVFHLPNAVDTDRFTPTGTRSNGVLRVIYCGTVGMAQGVGTLIDAADELASSDEELEVLIVGDGAERAELARQAAARGLAKVRFEGRVDRARIPALIESADIAVLSLRDVPLFEDALPTKMLEYMAAGRPVVAAAAGDVARLLHRSGAGIACPPEDASALADGIRELARDPERAQTMGVNGRRYVEAHYSREVFVDELERIALGLVGDDAERARVRRVYRSYEQSPARRRAWSARNPGNQRIIAALYARIRSSLIESDHFPRDGRVLLDIGCGHGDLIAWLVANGASTDCLHGVDVLEERVARARELVPEVTFEVADARALPLRSGSVSAVVLSTVLSSVVREDDRGRVAAEAMRVLAPDGLILCYDVRYPNPRNRSVRRIRIRDLKRLFADASIEARSLTLLPSLARRLGSATDRLYGPLAGVPPLRTHLFSVVRPRNQS